MSQIIAGLYEIDEQIGAGGGGVVYIGHHLRLEKRIVLKADKRKLSVGTTTLRREVDMLKNLTHTYIPQVYDFVQEGDTVYTVMDFIDGESLDKFIGRGQHIPQHQIIKWACQILEALVYLHSQPPHGILHGDIKPANIMLRANGDICLIDYNIALALGEDGAVKVGFSRGYASPEHYGADYIRSSKAAAVGSESVTSGGKRNAYVTSASDETDVEDKTETDDDKTLVDESITSRPSIDIKSTTNEKKGILLDVRSDIYSLGATLYHLLSGHKPAHDAREVVPLTSEECSLAVSEIIKKAMAPQPEERYQTAQEMLEAFLQLHVKDKRVVRRKKQLKAMTAVIATFFLVGGATTFIGLKQLEQRQEALALAEYSANALENGSVTEAVAKALEAIPTGKSILEAPVTAEAQYALTNALGVYQLEDGYKALNTIELASAPFDIAVSPSGKYTAVLSAYEISIFDTETQMKIGVLRAQESAMADMVFAGEECLIYAGEEGISAYDIGKCEQIWVGELATALAISGDEKVVAAVNRTDEKAILYRTSDGVQIGQCDFAGLKMDYPVNDIFADPENDIFALNEDGSRLAVSFAKGALLIFNVGDSQNDLIVYETSEYEHFAGGFYGKYFVFTARKSGESILGLIDTQEGIYLGEMVSQDSYLLQIDETGIYVSNASVLVKLDLETMEETELAYTKDTTITGFSVGKEHVLVATEDNGMAFFDKGANQLLKDIGTEKSDFLRMADNYAVVGNRTETFFRLYKLENYADKQILSYDARYQHDEARISYDAQTVMLFNYKSFCIYDMAGNLLVETSLPESETIYDQQFIKTEEVSYLEVIWYDGSVRHYNAANGQLMLEEKKMPPDKDLYEEFFIEGYRIASSLHGAPEVYDVETEELVTTLERDAYLTYVTQMDEYIITEYINADGNRYGLLLDKNFQKLAYLPKLCDVTKDGFIFDYDSGNLRQSKCYSLEELTEFAKIKLHP